MNSGWRALTKLERAGREEAGIGEVLWVGRQTLQ